MKQLYSLAALTLFAFPLSGCYMHHSNPHIDQMYQAKHAEAIYAHKLEARYHKVLSNLVPADALRVTVSIEFDLSQSQHTHINAPDEIGLLAESSSIKTHEKGNPEILREKTESKKYLAAQHKHEVIDYPGNLRHLGVVVLIDNRKIGDQNPDDLEEYIYEILEALIPASLDDNEQVEIIIAPFV